MCLNLTRKIRIGHYYCNFGVFIVNLEHIFNLFLCFHCWLRTSKHLQGNEKCSKWIPFYFCQYIQYGDFFPRKMYSKFEFAIKTPLTRVKVLIFNRVIHKNNTGGIIVEHVFANKLKLKLWKLDMISVELLFCLLLLSVLHHWK